MDRKKSAAVRKSDHGRQNFNEPAFDAALLSCVGDTADSGFKTGHFGYPLAVPDSGGNHPVFLRVRPGCQPPFPGNGLGKRGQRGKTEPVRHIGRHGRIYSIDLMHRSHRISSPGICVDFQNRDLYSFNRGCRNIVSGNL